MSDAPPRPRLATIVPVVTLVCSVIATAGLLFGVIQWYSKGSANDAMNNYQLQAMEQHLHALDGRMDATDARQRDQENRHIRLETVVENLRSSSNVPLQGRR
jgi:hypothetical protein